MAQRLVSGNLKQESCAFFLCDMQDKFRPAIKYFNDILEVAIRLVKTAKILEIPLIITEQYPKGLGHTVSELEISHHKSLFEKTKFSMLVPEVEALLTELQHVKQIVLFGVETHVCIQQTAIDLLAKDYEVFVVADGSSSRSQMDRFFAIERLRQAGCVLTTSESVMFQLIRDKEHAHFKNIQDLLRTEGPTSGLIPS